MLSESGGHVNFIEKRSGPPVTPKHRRRHSALGYQAPAVYAAARTHQ